MKYLRSIQENLRHGYLVDLLTPYLEGHHDVLDLGAASGLLAGRLAERCAKLSLVGVDVLAEMQSSVPMVAGNGRRLPFGEGTFDCVMMVDVLHHDKNPQELLAEAKRVSRRWVLIKDHYWETRLDLVLQRWADYIGNKPYGVKLPYTFLRMASWYAMIERTGLCVTKCSRFRFNALDPCKNVILYLEDHMDDRAGA